MPSKLRVLELYSGIGGMHWALKESGVDYEVLLAVDINTTANMVYKYNFPSVNLQSFGLEKLTLQKLECLNIDTILMSPPCQPFTRVGKKGDSKDVRTKSFLHILQLVREMKVKPRYLLVENVKGFEISQTRKNLIECLGDCGYSYQEFLLTPLQFGIPNCRLRYYLIARKEYSSDFVMHSEILTDIPRKDMSVPVHDTSSNRIASQNIEKPHACQILNLSVQQPTNTCSSINQIGRAYSSSVTYSNKQEPSSEESLINQSSIFCSTDTVSQSAHSGISFCSKCLNDTQENSGKTNKCDQQELKDAGQNMRYCEEEDGFINTSSQSLSDFMMFPSLDDCNEYWLSDKELRLFVVMDIVFPALKKSTCFTKRYGHYVDGAGSVVQMSSNVEDVQAASAFKTSVVKLKNRSEWGDAELNIIRKLKLRYFTPQEVANLLCFPSEFDFPPGVSKIQKYRVLGNSLNVHVVAELIKLMTQEVGT